MTVSAGAGRDAPELSANSRRVFRTYGVAVALESNDPELLSAAAARLPPDTVETSEEGIGVTYTLVSSRPPGGNRVLYRLSDGGGLVGEGFRLSRRLDELESAVRLYLAVHSPGLLFVHAGVVALKDRALVLPAASGAGKTTLVQALVELGATYYSDEYAVLDPSGLVHPYARSLSRRQGEHRRLLLDPEADLGGRRADRPVPVALVVHTRYSPGAVWHPRPLAAGESGLALFANTLGARERPAFAFSTLTRAILVAHSFAGDRGDASDAARALLRQLESTTPDPLTP